MVALPKVAEAVEQAGLSGKIVVTGMSTPKDMKQFVKRGTVKTVVLWNPVDLGYLAVYVARASLADTLKDNATQAKVPAGRLGARDAVASLTDITAKGPLTLKNVIMLGNPFRFATDISTSSTSKPEMAGNDAGHAQAVRRGNGRLLLPSARRSRR